MKLQHDKVLLLTIVGYVVCVLLFVFGIHTLLTPMAQCETKCLDKGYVSSMTSEGQCYCIQNEKVMERWKL